MPVKRRLYGATIVERLVHHREITPSGCWEWPGVRQPNGYGRITVDGTPRMVHRVSFEAFHGEIPPGLVIDHLCGNPPCYNPEHLRAVSQAENLLASCTTIIAQAIAKTHCVNGHAFTAENTKIDRAGKRVCLECRRQRDRARAQSPERKAYERERSQRRRAAGEWRKRP